MSPGGGFRPPDMANGERPTPPDGQKRDFQPPDFGKGESPVPPDGQKGDFQPPDFGGGAPPSMESSIGIKEGSEVVVQDADGTVLYTATAKGAMGNVIFSSPTLTTGQTYTVLVDGENVGAAEAKLGTKEQTDATNNTNPTPPTDTANNTTTTTAPTP